MTLGIIFGFCLATNATIVTAGLARVRRLPECGSIIIVIIFEVYNILTAINYRQAQRLHSSLLRNFQSRAATFGSRRMLSAGTLNNVMSTELDIAPTSAVNYLS